MHPGLRAALERHGIDPDAPHPVNELVYTAGAAIYADVPDKNCRVGIFAWAKPRIRPVGHTPGWWECCGADRRSIGRTPAAAYRSWLAAAQWGGA